jgi:hypothetical protein
MENFYRFYSAEENAERSDWVVERCIGPKHTLHTIVPSGFASYVRICHPGWIVKPLDPDDDKGRTELQAGWINLKNLTPVRWDDTAEKNDRIAHRLMQWPEICSPTPQKHCSSDVNPPLDGELTPDMVESLFEFLIDHSDSNQEVICGFWEGYCRSDTYSAKAKFESFAGQQNYLLFSSTLSKVREGWLDAHENVSSRHTIETVGLAPNALWSTTRDWYLAIPYNLQSSYFGGPADLVRCICSSGGLETYEALPDDDIYNDDISKAFLQLRPSS